MVKITTPKNYVPTILPDLFTGEPKPIAIFDNTNPDTTAAKSQNSAIRKVSGLISSTDHL